VPKLVVLAAILVAACCTGRASAAARPQQLPAGVVTIAGGHYGWFDGLSFARRYAGETWLGPVLAVVQKCPSVKLYGFISLTRGAGIVGRAPSNLLGCLSVTGGGPGAGATDGCAQAMLTPYPDPYRVSGLQLSRSYVLLVATSDTTCRDLATQLPGGIWARTTRSYNGVAANSLRVIKCQQWDGRRWWDFVATYSDRVPASKPSAVWIPDAYMNTTISRWNGVPSCN
jgi:hypothetical protein